ncbi:ATP-binding protein [Streptomyces sp. UNOC14_S4]|uniref:ATP-binding protein n=1 Tax=Streptomyces sp. UNOC14_S4 TaxID=2872340 RepID=UPI001E36D9B0|nr:ATP-binding protein [Streptomyces sp. UNOC14_S4]MCC3771549.1 ATP-binding protein [Streptomyces sp. UNOC14_S4]
MATVSPVDPWTYTLGLSRDPRSAGIARLAVRGILDQYGLGELIDRAALLTSELVTNACRYSDSDVTLRVGELHASGIRISVWDANPVVPEPFGFGSNRVAPARHPDATYGRGLAIVRECADNWGSQSLGRSCLAPSFRGKWLWCELVRKTAPVAVH